MSKTYLAAAMLLLFGCQSSPQDTVDATTTTTQKSPAGSSTTTRTTTKDGNTQVQHIVQRTHVFSSPQQPDYFRLVLRGDSITKGQIEFTITTQSGQKIYEENFTAADLEASMVYEMDSPTAAVPDREAYILKRMDDFVEAADFVSPAIAPNAPVQASFVNETVWKRIQANPKAIGFKYLLGKEDGHLLVYDAEQQKAVRYGSFGG